MFVLSFFFFLLFFFGVFLSIVFWSLHNGISPMPTSTKAKNAILKLLPSEVKGDILELGSGWGTLAFPIADHYPHLAVFAYETSFIPFYFSKIRQFVQQRPNLKLIRQNFFTTSFHNGEVIVCYLYPEAMWQLKEKFEQELKPGTWIISNTFAIPGWKPFSVIELDDLYHSKVYLYQRQ